MRGVKSACKHRKTLRSLDTSVTCRQRSGGRKQTQVQLSEGVVLGHNHKIYWLKNRNNKFQTKQLGYVKEHRRMATHPADVAAFAVEVGLAVDEHLDDSRECLLVLRRAPARFMQRAA